LTTKSRGWCQSQSLSPRAEEQNLAGGDMRNRPKKRRRRFNIYKWGELGCGLGVCLVLAGGAGGVCCSGFFSLDAWPFRGWRLFNLERLSDREVLGRGWAARASPKKKKLLMPSAFCLCHTQLGARVGKSGAINEDGPWGMGHGSWLLQA
jgi:hypothetical protein